MKFNYTPKNVCSRNIEIEIDDNGIILSVAFLGGCNGNLKGISSLCEGMHIDDVIDKLENIRCGFKNTSCPAQLADALKFYKSEKEG